MTNLRFRYRHVHATLYTHLRTQLIALGWGDSSLQAGDPANANINFGVAPMTFRDFQPDEAGIRLDPMTVAVTLGDEPPREDMELGAGLAKVPYPLYVDVYGDRQATAQAVASDVKDILEDLFIPIKDFTTSPPVATDGVIEIFHEDIASGRPPASLMSTDIKRYWRTVMATAHAEYLV